MKNCPHPSPLHSIFISFYGKPVENLISIEKWCWTHAHCAVLTHMHQTYHGPSTKWWTLNGMSSGCLLKLIQCMRITAKRTVEWCRKIAIGALLIRLWIFKREFCWFFGYWTCFINASVFCDLLSSYMQKKTANEPKCAYNLCRVANIHITHSMKLISNARDIYSTDRDREACGF